MLTVVFGTPALPHAIFLTAIAIGGFTVDILGGLYGNWGNTKVSTASLGEVETGCWGALAGAVCVLLGPAYVGGPIVGHDLVVCCDTGCRDMCVCCHLLLKV